MKLHIAHISMQFSDSERHQRSDVTKIFQRAIKQDYAWITGTEAGPGAGELYDLLKSIGGGAGYRVWRPRRTDSWVAVRDDLVLGRWETSCTHVLDGTRDYGPKGVVEVSFLSPFGRVTVLACHYPTKGDPGARDPARRVNVDENRALARVIGEIAREEGKGRDLVFYGGDQNIVDRVSDTFFGEPLTSTWDELGKWAGTGHGNIDVIATYDHDKRVKAISSRALDDSEFKLHTDHWLVEAVIEIGD